MSMRTWLPLVLATLIAPAATARAQYHESTTVDASTAVFNDIASIPERGIPHGLLTDAQGFAIVPGLIKAGFIVGGRYGKGIVVVRDQKTGGWSSPVLVWTGDSGGARVGSKARAERTSRPSSVSQRGCQGPCRRRGRRTFLFIAGIPSRRRRSSIAGRPYNRPLLREP